MGAANARPLPTLGARSRPRATRAKGRTCLEPGCTTVISIYNEADRCWLHAEAPRRPPLADP